MSKFQPLTALKQFVMNPVIDKEYRLRMRTSRSMLIILFYLVAIGLFSGVIFSALGFSYNDPFSDDTAGIRFIALCFIQLGLIAFMSPALTAGGISSEREKQTLNLLLTTQQSSFNIVMSKLLSSIGFMLLIVFSTLPIYGIVFLYGGITPLQLLSIFCFYIFCMLLFGSFGILFSTIFKRTIVAVVLSFIAVFALFILTLVIYLIVYLLMEYFFYNNNTSRMYRQIPEYILHILALNPGFAMYSLLDDVNWSSAMGLNYNPGNTGNTKTYFDYVPFWLEFFVVYTFVFILNIWLAVRKLRPIKKKSKRAKGV